MVTTPFMFLHILIFVRISLSCFLVSLCISHSHDGGNPSCRKEKRSKHNQDRTIAPKLTGRTKVAYPHDGAGGSRAQAKHARGRGA